MEASLAKPHIHPAIPTSIFLGILETIRQLYFDSAQGGWHYHYQCSEL